MFAMLRRLFQRDAGPTDIGAVVAHMDLEERMAWRREMLYRSVRESMATLEVLSGMYKFKVSRVDDRGHRYIVMVDVAQSFAVGRSSPVRGFSGIEAMIKKSAYDRYGLVVMGMYWRTNDDVNVFERQSRRGDSPSVAQAVLSGQLPARGSATGAAALSRTQFQPVSQDEAAAFMAALEKGMRPPAVHVGEKTYQSDMAPLSDDGIMIGGTQYCELR